MKNGQITLQESEKLYRNIRWSNVKCQTNTHPIFVIVFIF